MCNLLSSGYIYWLSMNILNIGFLNITIQGDHSYTQMSILNRKTKAQL